MSCCCRAAVLARAAADECDDDDEADIDADADGDAYAGPAADADVLHRLCRLKNRRGHQPPSPLPPATAAAAALWTTGPLASGLWPSSQSLSMPPFVATALCCCCNSTPQNFVP